MQVKLRELLLKENIVTPQQIQEALNHQKIGGGKLGKALVSLGFVKDEEITSLLSRQFGVPSINLDHLEVDPAILKIIPVETARKYEVLPLSLTKKTLALAMADPTDVFAMDDIRFMTGYKVAPYVASEIALEEAIHRYYGSSPARENHSEIARRGGAHELPSGGGLKDGPGLSVDDMASIGGLSEIDLDSLGEADGEVDQVKSEDEEIDLAMMSKSADAAPVIKLTNVLLVDSLKRGASDIHVEPYEREFRVRFRIDGILYNVMALPMMLKDPLTSRIKLMARMNVAEKRLPQEGRIRIKIKLEDRSRHLDFRVSVRPTLWGETIAMRLLDKSNLILDMTKLGFEPLSLERFKNAISKPYGIVLVTGPTGTGKTNTLYSAVANLNKPDINIMTAEHSVDFNIPGINQVQVNPQVGESLATVLRSLLRQDTNIILVSEILEREAAEIAVNLAQHGHLVLTTLPTNDAPSTVSHLVNMGIQPYLIGTTVNLIQAQRLVRRICAKCKFDDTPNVPAKTLVDIGLHPDVLGSFQVMKGKGCATCNGTGYKGRVGLFEVMEISEGIRDLIVVGASVVEIKRMALEDGMLTLRMSGLQKLMQGITTIEEVLRETVL